jgi:hypothetical protein
MRRSRKLTLSLLASLVLGALLASPAFGGAFGFKDLEVSFTAQDGSELTQAGAHPFAFTTAFKVNTTLNGEGKEIPDGEAKNLILGQIPGFAGDPLATPRCASAEFSDVVDGAASCPDSSALGFASIRASFSPVAPGSKEFVFAPVYNLEPPPGVAAKLGFVILNVPVTIEVGLNEKPPYNIVANITRIPQIVLFYSSKVTLWGNPADSAHNALRGKCLNRNYAEEPTSLGLCPVNIPARPFLTMPRSCKGPLKTTLFATAWGTPEATSSDEAITPTMTGCNKLGLDADIEARPSGTAAESPAGLEFTMNLEDEGLGNPKGIANADVEKVEATLPAGVTANPSAAEGLGVCTLAQYESASLTNRGCPEAAKLGGVLVRTPLLEDPIEGSLFLAQPDDPAAAGRENPFDTLIALYILIRSERYGIFVGQAGKVEPDPVTGQLRTTFEGIPEVPLSEITVRFREGPRSPLVTPPLCGTYETGALLYPSSGAAPVPTTSSFTISSGPNGTGCPPGARPFAPGFEAGSLNNNAGTYSPFYMRLTRKDGEQDMTRFDSVLPPGVTGKIAGVPRCPDSAIAAAKAKTGRQELASPSCPAASQIGRVLAGAGVGPALTYVPGSIYLGGPVGSAPLSVIVITPAVAGPFDAGTVVVREALDLDPNTAQVQVNGALSDPIPHILKGIPLKLRDLRVYIDRPGFTLNPTGCEPKSVNATLFGSAADLFSPADDVPANLSSYFQASNCANLAFKPKLGLQLKGATKRGGHSAATATLTPHKNNANIKAVTTLLPHSQFIDQDHINNPCTRAQFAANACPKSSILGTARAFTPLLDEPLEGKVYFRSNGGERELPDIVADVRGQGFRIIQVGFVDSKNARIRVRFLSIPDAPVSKIVLKFKGGKEGLLENSENLCARKQVANVKIGAHNGRSVAKKLTIATSCKKKK